jgi:hypothetical protein
MRKRGILAAAGAASLVITGVASGVSGATGAPGSLHRLEQVLKLKSITVEFNSVDAPPKGNSLGDQIIFGADLYRGTRKIGTDSEACVVTRTVGTGDWTCNEVLDLPKGKISIAILFQFRPTGVAPITGGTGAYRDAGGYVVKRNSGEDYTLHIDRLEHSD